MVDDEAITIRLTRDQAFVLSDWLYQVMFRSDDLEGIVHDRAVWSPIYAISGTLDKTLSEIFMPDYGPRLEAAKERLRTDLYGETGGSTTPSRGCGHRITSAPDPAENSGDPRCKRPRPMRPRRARSPSSAPEPAVNDRSFPS